MFKLLFSYFVMSAVASDIPSLIEKSKQAALQYQDEVLPIAEKAAQIQKNVIDETTKVNLSQSGKSCRQSHDYSLKREELNAPLKIFVSSSMPKESLKALHQQAQRIGARVVFRGLINNSFKETQRYFKDLAISADIDPPAFDDHRITHVPTFVLGGEKNKTDQIQGNITLEEALSIMAEKGELKSLARELKDRFHEARS